jgi:hypothetical protein
MVDGRAEQGYSASAATLEHIKSVTELELEKTCADHGVAPRKGQRLGSAGQDISRRSRP